METQTDTTRSQVLMDILEKLQYFSKLYGIDSLFVAGGFCRSLYLGKLDDTNDIDVASAYPDEAIQFGGLFASEVLKVVPTFYERSGTAMIEYPSEAGLIKIEFQSKSTNAYMYNSEIIEWMRRVRIEDVPLMHNLYGRDFTINSLIYSISDDELLDPTGRAEESFEQERITSLLPPKLLIKYNPVCILRAIRFSLQYDFRIDASLRTEMKENIGLLKSTLSEERLMNEFSKILRIKSEHRLETLKSYGLDAYLLHPSLKEYINLDDKNE